MNTELQMNQCQFCNDRCLYQLCEVCESNKRYFPVLNEQDPDEDYVPPHGVDMSAVRRYNNQHDYCGSDINTYIALGMDNKEVQRLVIIYAQTRYSKKEYKYRWMYDNTYSYK
jgi:hypothetical protein